MRTLILAALAVSALALGACRSADNGDLTPTGTGVTPSSGTVPGQTPS